jgi:SAM-dependent methyltransferase
MPGVCIPMCSWSDGGTPSVAGVPDNQPDDDYFACMAASAGGHWWYVARRNLVADAFGGRVPRGCVALDVGTGTGEFLDTLAAMGAGLSIGTELSEPAIATAMAAAGQRVVVRSVAEHLPVANASVDRLTSLDVIEHLDDDLLAVREFKRVCAGGARMVITVPAYQSLWSEHDDRAAHRRRYNRREVCEVVTAAGFTVERASYCFSFLVPPAWLLRRTPLRHLVTVTDEEVSSPGGVVDRALAGLAAVERWWLRRWTLPFGLSIIVVASTTD